MHPGRGITAVLVASSCWAALLSAQDRFPVQRLTFDPAQEGFPSWSPDGATIVYSHGTDAASLRFAGLYTVASTGGPPQRLTHEIGEHPNWSREGYYIVFDAEEGNSIKVTTSRGGPPIRIVPAAIPVRRGGLPLWSPDGARIAFKEGPNLWVLEVGTGDTRVFYTAPEGKIPLPGCWSPDGAAVYFTLRDADSPASSIWATLVDGEDTREIVPAGEHGYRYMDLSPDGSMLAFVQCSDRSACDLWVTTELGGPKVQLTTHPAYDDTPRWSPDGTRIAFTSTRTYGFDVWVMSVDPTELRAALDSASAIPHS
jgi:Tol biopolymer transport system component